MYRDPVCGMTVREDEAAGKSEYEGRSYFFCSPGCKAAFDKAPHNYAHSQPGHEEHSHQGHSQH